MGTFTTENGQISSMGNGMHRHYWTIHNSQKRYERGMINAIELGQAKTLFATAQNQNLQAHLRLRVNTSTLDFYKGLPLFNIN